MFSRISFSFCCVVAAVALLCSASAQSDTRLNISAGAGFSVPTDRAGINLNNGWNLDFRGGVNVTRHLEADVDFAYNHWGLNSAALARFHEPGGSTGIWSLTFNPVVHFRRIGQASPYLTVGSGLYHRNLSLTRPTTTTVLVCDPFFGFCNPAIVGVNEVVASNSIYKAGFNGGAGFDIPLRGRTKIFAEARYQRMFTNHGADFTYVPATFGIRW